MKKKFVGNKKFGRWLIAIILVFAVIYEVMVQVNRVNAPKYQKTGIQQVPKVTHKEIEGADQSKK